MWEFVQNPEERVVKRPGLGRSSRVAVMLVAQIAHRDDFAKLVSLFAEGGRNCSH